MSESNVPFGCPVCNGLKAAIAPCPTCERPMTDAGKLQDYFANYSPYRESDDLRLTNRYVDLETSHCMHVFYCKACGKEETLGIQETQMP